MTRLCWRRWLSATNDEGTFDIDVAVAFADDEEVVEEESEEGDAVDQTKRTLISALTAS